jgi:diadenosine tetraphosphatase ApaH/serine/threonine PP2A family protein phosphatase
VHGSPLDEDEYLVDSAEAEVAFRYVGAGLVFFGHTHLQGGFIWRREGVQAMSHPAWHGGSASLQLEADAAYMVNPGSVGQPRDNDPRAAFVLYDSDARVLTWRRLEYDIATAQEKIRRAGLPPVLADRLSLGR